MFYRSLILYLLLVGCETSSIDDPVSAELDARKQLKKEQVVRCKDGALWSSEHCLLGRVAHDIEICPALFSEVNRFAMDYRTKLTEALTPQKASDILEAERIANKAQVDDIASAALLMQQQRWAYTVIVQSQLRYGQKVSSLVEANRMVGLSAGFARETGYDVPIVVVDQVAFYWKTVLYNSTSKITFSPRDSAVILATQIVSEGDTPRCESIAGGLKQNMVRKVEGDDFYYALFVHLSNTKVDCSGVQ